MGGFDNDAATAFGRSREIVSADLPSWLMLEYQAIATLAGLLDRVEDQHVFLERADALSQRINNLLWNEHMESYSAWHLTNGRHHFGCLEGGQGLGEYAFQSCSNLIPLYVGIASQEQGEAMIRRYVLNPDHFWSPWGIRSLSKASEFYNNAKWGNPPRFGYPERFTNSNWQGPVWIPICYFVFHALLRYGFCEEARILADNTVRLLADSLNRIGSFTENYHAETGEPLYATEFASWNLLADTMHTTLMETRA